MHVDACPNTSTNADTNTSKYNKLLHTYRPAQTKKGTCPNTHTNTHVVNVFSLQAAPPEMLLPSGPQSRPSTLITGRQDSVLY